MSPGYVFHLALLICYTMETNELIKTLVIDYLQYTDTKSTTILGLCLLLNKFNLDPELCTEVVSQMYLDGVIDIHNIESRLQATIRLIPKFEVL